MLGQNNQTSRARSSVSTGLRINRGKDDPAGLIASQNLRAEQSAIGAAIKNADAPDQVVNIAEGGLNEVSMLTGLQGLLTSTANDAGLSAEEKEANQADRLDPADHRPRCVGHLVPGQEGLNGNLDYTTTSIDSNVSGFKVNGASSASTRPATSMCSSVGSGRRHGDAFGGNNIDLTDADSAFTIEVAGNEGSRE